MVAFLLRRLVSAVALLVVVTAVTFALTGLVSDPTREILGPGAAHAQIVAKRHQLGLDRPLPERYLTWLGHAMHGDLGVSWFTSLRVSDTISARLPVTLSLALLATLVSAVLGMGFGLVAAVRRGWLDRAVQVVAALGFAVPGLWLALLLVSAFAVSLHWFPAIGYVPLTRDPAGWLRSLVLPVTAIAVGSVAAVATQTRNAVVAVLGREYVRTLRARGLPRRRLLLHVLRNGAPTTLTIVGLQFIGMLGGAIVVEQIFALQGLGGLASAGATHSDVPVVLGVVVVGVLIVLAVNLLVDLAVGLLDPRVRA